MAENKKLKVQASELGKKVLFGGFQNRKKQLQDMERRAGLSVRSAQPKPGKM